MSHVIEPTTLRRVDRRRPNVADGILDAIGQTPLVRLRRYLDEPNVELHVKLEASNPGGSAKDRPAKQMLEHALVTGEIGSETTVIESSSGNMGIGLAQACRYHGLRFMCVVDPRAQPQNVAIMRALGAEIDFVSEPLNGDFLAARLARVCERLEQIPNSFWPNQYSNRQNPLAHQQATMREILAALGGDLDYLFVATSSTGTAQGCRDYLLSEGLSTSIVAVDAAGSALFGGTPGCRSIPGLGAGREPRLARGQTFDRVERISDLDCVVGCRRAARREALLIGGSAGGVLEVVRSMESELVGARCAAILHDSGTRYMDTIFSDDWVHDVLGASPAEVEHWIDQPARSSSAERLR